jgi:hypothetical protein
MSNAPSYMRKVEVPSKTRLLNTADMAHLLGKSRRTVRRYAQYAQLKAAGKTHRLGWVFRVTASLTVG